MVCPEGLEPPTPSLEGLCSIQMSYGQHAVCDGSRITEFRTENTIAGTTIPYSVHK